MSCCWCHMSHHCIQKQHPIQLKRRAADTFNLVALLRIEVHWLICLNVNTNGKPSPIPLNAYVFDGNCSPCLKIHLKLVLTWWLYRPEWKKKCIFLFFYIVYSNKSYDWIACGRLMNNLPLINARLLCSSFRLQRNIRPTSSREPREQRTEHTRKKTPPTKSKYI